MTRSYNTAITGAAGFIGSHCAAELERLGSPARLLLGPSQGMGVPGFLRPSFWLCADIADGGALDQLFAGVNTVIHACGPPSVSASKTAAAEYLRVHGVGTATVLESCVRCKVRRLVYVSSAEVYGHSHAHAVSEDQETCASSPYAAAKIAAEEMIRVFVREGLIEAISLRPFSIYGPRMSATSVVAEVIAQARHSHPIRLRDANAIRDFCFVGDAVQAIAAACTAEINGFEIINVGTGVPTRIGELASVAASIAGSHDEGSNAPNRVSQRDTSRLVANTVKAQTILGWKASTPLRSGLASVIHELGGQACSAQR